MTLWLRATKWFPASPARMVEPGSGRYRELVAQSHKEWSV
jgi:hypothetical protein